MSSTVAAVIIMQMISPLMDHRRAPLYRQITDGNRLHKDRARPGSVEHLERLAAAEDKRARKLAKAPRI